MVFWFVDIYQRNKLLQTALFWAAMLALTLSGGTNDGVDDIDGDSTYQIWLTASNIYTEVEVLTSHSEGDQTLAMTRSSLGASHRMAVTAVR